MKNFELNKKIYEAPTVTVMETAMEDIVTASGFGGEGDPIL